MKREQNLEERGRFVNRFHDRPTKYKPLPPAAKYQQIHSPTPTKPRHCKNFDGSRLPRNDGDLF
jgi:hypothetical protein